MILATLSYEENGNLGITVTNLDNHQPQQRALEELPDALS